MGTIAVIEATVDATIKTGKLESGFVDVVTTENLVKDKVYYVICSGITSDSTESGIAPPLFHWQLYDETNSEVVDGSLLTRAAEVHSAPPQDRDKSYYFVGRITAGATQGGLAFQQKGYAQGSTEGYLPAQTEFLSMLLLDVSAMDDADYFYANDTSAQINMFTFRSMISHTISQSDIANGDEWLVFAGSETWINNTIKETEMRLGFESSLQNFISPSIKFEGKHLDEKLLWWMCRNYTLNPSGGDVAWDLEGRAAAGQNSYTANATLIGIKVSSLDYFTSYNEAATVPTDEEFLEMESNTFTPTSDGKVIVAATSIFDAGGEDMTAGQRIQKNNTTIPNDVPDTFTLLNTNDASDLLPLSYITVYDGASGEDKTISYDVRIGTYESGAAFSQTTLAIFGTATIEKVTFSAVAKQVYTSGDVASETFDAGSKATQGFASGDVAGQGFASGDKASQSHSGGDVEAEARP